MADLKPTFIDPDNPSQLREPRAGDNFINEPDVSFDTISDLTDYKIDQSPRTKTANVMGYYSAGDGGGGTFYWDSSEDKANHNGGTIINPEHNSTIGSANWYSATGDATDTSGSGCWVRSTDLIILKHFGYGGGSAPNSALSAYDNINQPFKVEKLKVGRPGATSLPTNQKLISANGLRVDVNGVGEEVSIVGDAQSQLVKIHDTRTALGQATMYVKNDGGGGSIRFDRTLPDGTTLEFIGSIGALGATIGNATNQDDLTIVGSAQGTGTGADSTGAVRIFADSNQEVVAFNALDTFPSTNNQPHFVVGKTGGAAGFTNGDLIITSRRTANTKIHLVATDGTAMTINHDKSTEFFGNVSVQEDGTPSFYINDLSTTNKNLRIYATGSQVYLRPNANSGAELGWDGSKWICKANFSAKSLQVTDVPSTNAGTASGNYLPITVNGTAYKVELLNV